jgi:RNA polymerase sigma factor for flagellar operon FliA
MVTAAHHGHGLDNRNAEILRFLPLVRAIAIRVSRRYPSNLEVEDLVNIGTIGMMEALDRFEPDRGVPLKAFAELRIRGAMVDAIRKTDWVPREVRRRNHVVGEARRALHNRLGREPSRFELAQALELSPEALDDLIASAVTRSVVSLDATVSGDSDTTLSELVPDEDGVSPMDAWILDEDRDALTQAMSTLPEDERAVMDLYYGHGMKYREIGLLMGICESRVCQLRGHAVDRLRKRVNLRSSGTTRVATVHVA